MKSIKLKIFLHALLNGLLFFILIWMIRFLHAIFEPIPSTDYIKLEDLIHIIIPVFSVLNYYIIINLTKIK